MSTMRYPVLLSELDPTHPGYIRGKRFGVQQHDGDEHLFARLADAADFMFEHEMVMVRPVEMAAMRAALAADDGDEGED